MSRKTINWNKKIQIEEDNLKRLESYLNTLWGKDKSPAEIDLTVQQKTISQKRIDNLKHRAQVSTAKSDYNK